MKKAILFFVLILSMSQAKAQYPKLIVQFTNKQNNSFSITNPAAYLTTKAVTRRTKYNIAVDSTDLPITQRYIDSVVSKGPLTVLSKSKWLNQILIQCTDVNTINKIQALPFVKKVQGIGYRIAQTPRDKFVEKLEPIDPNQLLQQRTTADIYNYGNNYAQVHIHEGEFLHNKGFSGQGMMIAVLDAGFSTYKTLSVFDSVRNNNQVLGERDFVAFDNSVNEDDAHGMQCWSTMAANKPGTMVGTSPKANYWIIRTENAATEYPIEEFNWVVGAEFADSCGVDLISSSLGYTDFDDVSFNHTYAQFYKNIATVTQGASLAAKKGLIIMNSAGNDGGNSWKYIGFPADADSVCSVGAVNTSGVVAGFSSYGFTGKIKPNIASVGAGTIVANTGNTTFSGSGTSYSNPNVAGLVACLWQAFPQYNNMKILDAVYKSCHSYATPNDRIGYGIPNFKTAYRLLKKDQNIALYGNEWLWATPNPFTNKIDVQLIGQLDGNAMLEVINASNVVVATKNITTELEEVYNYTFTALDNLPGGVYTIKYTDANKSRSITLTKVVTTPPLKDWLVAYPTPFNKTLTCYLKAPETASIALRLVDITGKLIEKIEMTVTQNNIYNINFKTAYKLSVGAYTIQYIGSTEKKTIRIVKL